MDLEMSPDVVVSKPKEPSLWLPLFAFGVVVGDFWEILNNNGGWGMGFYLRLRFYVFAILGFYLREKGVFLEKKVCVWRKRCIFVG